MKRVLNILILLAVPIAFAVILPINHDRIIFKWWGGWEGRLPLSVMLLFAFGLGMAYALFFFTANYIYVFVEKRGERYVARNEQKALQLLDKSEALLKKGKADDAESMLRKAILLSPKSVKLHDALGKLYVDRRDYRGALNAYGKATIYKPEDVGLSVKFASISLKMGESHKAIKSLEKILETDAKNIDALKLLPPAYADAEMFEEACGAQDKYIRQVHDDLKAEARTMLAAYKTELAKGTGIDSPKKAAKLLAEVLNETPDFLPAVFIYADIAISRDKRDEAFSTLRKAFDIRPEPALYSKMAATGVADAFNRTEDAAEESLKNNPRNHALRIMRAKAFIAREKSKEALDELEKISGVPSIEHLSAKAAALVKLNRVEEAAEIIARAVESMNVEYRCDFCGNKYKSWMPRCAGCESYNTLTALAEQEI